MKHHIAKPVVAVGLGVGAWAALLAFRPESETRGAEDGARAGMRVWFRMMGRRTPERLDGAHIDTAPLGSVSGWRRPRRLWEGALWKGDVDVASPFNAGAVSR